MKQMGKAERFEPDWPKQKAEMERNCRGAMGRREGKSFNHGWARMGKLNRRERRFFNR